MFRYRNTYQNAVNLLAKGVIDVKPLISAHYPLKDVLQGFEHALTGAGGAIKIMFDVD